ncbi:MAG: bacterial Ig-like domain-containing protein [Bacilli bacterium]|nr:bacterial Ig-like domain-containing protein [Bacilli bacterium]
MNKLIKRLSGMTLGLALCFGFSFSLGNKESNQMVRAEDAEQVSYGPATFDAALPTDGYWTGNNGISYCGGYGNKKNNPWSATLDFASATGIDWSTVDFNQTVSLATSVTAAGNSASGNVSLILDNSDTQSVTYAISEYGSGSNAASAKEKSMNIDSVTGAFDNLMLDFPAKTFITEFSCVLTYYEKASSNNTLTSISLSGDYAVKFYIGQEFSHTGCTVTASYDDNSTKDVTNKATFTGYDMTAAGNQTVIVSYTENDTTKTASYSINVVDIVSIAVTTSPNRTTYIDGESFDSTGMVVTATYSDSTTADVTSNCTFTPNPLTEGTTSVTVAYGGQTTTQNITVNAAPSYAKITDLTKMDKVFIVSSKNNVNYVLPGATNTNSAPSASITANISSNKLIGGDTSNLFTVEKSGSTYAFKNSENKYLYISGNDNNNIRVGSTNAAYWTITATSNGFKMTYNNRWLGVYQTSDWRSYNSSSHANYGGSAEAINFYGITKETSPLTSIELTNYPTSEVDIGYKTTLGYSGLDSNSEEWAGNVVYTTSDASIVTVNATTGELQAVAPGTANVTVYANAGVNNAKVESNPITVTVLADPIREDLPVGIYNVNIDYSGVAKDDTVPSTVDYEIKAKEGSGEDRKWYKNMSVAYSNVSASYAHEYTWNEGSTMVMTNNSNGVVTGLEIKYYNSKRLNVTDSNNNVVNEVSDSSDVVTYSLNSSSFTLTGKEAGTSVYYVKVTMNVADENEDFLSLVVSKDSNWDKSSYKIGQTPVADGLIVTANYTVDGTTISRSEDVTASVNSWSFNPSELSLTDTSFTATASWGGYSSSAFTVTGISVSEINGELDSGRYFISATKALEVKQYTNADSDAVDITSTSAWDFKLVDDNTYTISTTIDGTKYYLYSSGVNTGLRTHTTPTNWELTALTGDDAGKYSLSTIANDDNERYLCDYSSGTDWRTYLDTAKGSMYKLTITEEKEVFANNFKDSFTAGCIADGGYIAENMDWAAAKAQFNTLSDENKTMFVNAEYTVSGSGADTVVTALNDTPQYIAEVVAKYDAIISRYYASNPETFDEFMGRIDAGKISYSPRGMSILEDLNSSDSYVILILVVITGFSSCAAYLLLKKRKTTISK